MAKDGTNRGGRRPKSGKKSAKKAENLTLFDGVTNLGHLVSKEEMEGVEIPDASAYLKAKQKKLYNNLPR